MNQSSDSNIERMRRRLDSRGDFNNEPKEGKLSSADRSSVQDDWEHDEPPHDDLPKANQEENSGMSFLNKLLIFSCIFFVLAFGFAIFSVGTGESDISPDKVNIKISGPEEVSAGNTVDFTVSITNQNKVDLQEAELVVVYPEGTRDPANTGEELRRERDPLGTIAAGRTTQETVTASLFGEQGETLNLEVQLEYRITGSNAIFTASNIYEVEITEAPISLEVSIPEETTSNQLFTTEVVVRSNTSQILDDVLLVVSYPFGFSAQEVSPEAAYRQHVWQLGDISPGAERTIEIQGLFAEGSSSAEQTFRFNVGTAQVADATSIGTLFAAQDRVISLEDPFINLGLDLDVRQNRSSNSVEIFGNGTWLSSLQSIVRGGVLTVELTGDGIDYSSIESNTGLYDASAQSIIWNSQTNSELTTISPGDSGRFEFEFATESTELLAEIAENPSITVAVRMQARAPDSSSLPDPVTASLERTIRLPTVLQLSADTLYEDGPFTNSGPTPPQVGEETSYTLHLSISNTTNNISEAQLSAAVPAYVEISGSAQPGGSNFSYNEISGRIQWDIGSISAGAGYTNSPKEIFIPVTIRPTQNHVGSTLTLLEDISITGTDTSRDETIQLNGIQAPTTALDDLRSSQGDGRVQP